MRRHALLLAVSTLLGLTLGVIASAVVPKRFTSSVSLRVGQLGSAGVLEPLSRVAARVHERLRALENETRCSARASVAGTLVEVSVTCDDAQLAMQRLDAGVRPVLTEHRASFDAAVALERARIVELRSQTGALTSELARLSPGSSDELAGTITERLRAASVELAAAEEGAAMPLTFPTEIIGELAPGMPQGSVIGRIAVGALLGLAVGALGMYLREQRRRAPR